MQKRALTGWPPFCSALDQNGFAGRARVRIRSATNFGLWALKGGAHRARQFHFCARCGGKDHRPTVVGDGGFQAREEGWRVFFFGISLISGC